jgi:lipid-binding SYLF domain-containing protein
MGSAFSFYRLKTDTRRTIMLKTIARPAGLLITCLALLAGCASTSTPDDAHSTADASQATLSRFMQDPEMRWLRENMPRAKAVLISPRILQAGFIVGGSGGNAILQARSTGSPGWTGPAFYKLATGSIGLQAGAESSEMVALVLTDKGLNSFLSSGFKLGGDVSVAAGPVTIKVIPPSTATRSCRWISSSRTPPPRRPARRWPRVLRA